MSTMKTARLKAGLTAAALAEKADTKWDRVYFLEGGRYRPRADEARRLSNVLAVPIETLFPNGTQPEMETL